MTDRTEISRRQALRLAAAGVTMAALAPAGCTGVGQDGETGAATAAGNAGGESAPDWLRLLATSAQDRRNVIPRVEGTIPRELNGSLYRNGPGLFERDGVRKRHLLDGDGLVQRLSFSGGQVHYRNAFVQTPKFREEEEAGRYRYSTWSTRRPGGPLFNLGGGPMASQAGITVYPVGDALYALDEANPVFELDPETLETLGSRVMGTDMPSIKAHTKLDPVTGDWLLVGQGFDRTSSLHALVCDRNGRCKYQHRVDDMPMVYFHDFLVTENYFIYVLHPCEFSPWGFLLGTRSVIDSLDWRPEKGSRIVLLPRSGGEPIHAEASGTFMWHGLNAYERGQEIIADLVTYDHPDHFIGDHEPRFRAMMDGRLGRGEEPGKVRRYVINTRTGHLREEVLHAGNHEFPFVDPRVVGRKHRVGYYACSGPGVLQTGVKRMDMVSGAEQVFDFGEGTYVGEPVFAARPGGDVDEGVLIAQCLDGASRRTFFALFNARSVGDGPLARVWLDHALPISFHGWWQG